MHQHPNRTLKRVSPVTNAYYVRAVIDGERQNIGVVRYRNTDSWEAETCDGRYLGTAKTDRRAADIVAQRSSRESQANQYVERLRRLVARAEARREQRIAVDLPVARAVLKALDHRRMT